MKNIKELLGLIEFEFDLVCDYVWKSPNFIKHETELEKRKLKSYFPDDDRLASMRWSLESLKLEHIYPKAISMGNLFYVSSLFETYMLRLAKELENNVGVSFSEQKGQGISKILKYLKKCNLEYTNSEYWSQVESMLKIRNCLAHANGNLSFARNPDELTKIVNNNLYLNSVQKKALKGRLTKGYNDDVKINSTDLGNVLTVKNECAYLALLHYKDFLVDICSMYLNQQESNEA